MLKFLSIKNLVLIESCEIEFHQGLNILSGESGAGKTALLDSLSLVLGGRADGAMLRRGAGRASVEAAFAIESSSDLLHILSKAGIEMASGELLLLRRELTNQRQSQEHPQVRGRAFVNCQMVPLPLLQEIGSHLVDIISQHAHHSLRTLEAQRALLDQFAETTPDLLLFQEAWEREKQLDLERTALEEEAASRERAMQKCAEEEEELLRAAVQEGEEERLFEEYNRLSHRQELIARCAVLDERFSTLPSLLAQNKQALEQLASIDPALGEIAELTQEALIPLKEATRSLGLYLGRLETDPDRLAFLEDRLKQIDKIKRKYGDPIAYLKELKERMLHFENLEEAIERAQNAHAAAAGATKEFAATLSQKRLAAAALLEKRLTETLISLNMPHGVVRIAVTPQPRSAAGEETVSFYLSANKGELPVPVKERASGGELSRLLLALKTLLAAKNSTPTLLFDEIDANVGGKTAAMVGDQLLALGAHRQVICVTHFPQVAAKADHHFSLFKEEHEGRTLARIALLDPPGRERELQRMLGE